MRPGWGIQVTGPLGENDEAGTCAPDWEAALDHGPQRVVEVEVLYQAAEGAALAAGHDQAVQVAQAIGRADLPHVGAEAAKDGLMFDEIALEGEDSYGCHFGFYSIACRMYSRPYGLN